MVLRRSHLGDEKGRTLAGTTRANCRRALGWGRDPALHFPSTVGREFMIRQARVWVVGIAVDWTVNSSTSDRIQFLPSGTSDPDDCPL